jgi:hypothetical protein
MEAKSGQNGNAEGNDKRTYPNGFRNLVPGDGNVKFVLEQAMKYHSGIKAIALDGVNATPVMPREGDPVSIVQEVG